MWHPVPLNIAVRVVGPSATPLLITISPTSQKKKGSFIPPGSVIVNARAAVFITSVLSSIRVLQFVISNARDLISRVECWLEGRDRLWKDLHVPYPDQVLATAVTGT